MTPTATRRFNWSDLARNPSEVGNALDNDGEVLVTRDNHTLRLAPEDPNIVNVMRDLCKLLGAVVATDTPEHVTAILTAAWPWTRALPAEDQIELAREVGPLAETSESLGTWRPLLDSLAAWRGTARAWADGHHPVGPFEGEATTEVARP